nr:protein 100 [synthetic construct]
MDAVGAVPGAENPFQNPAVIVADWLGFIILGGSSIILCYKLMGFYGSDNKQKYFIGYREEKMLSVYVNTFAAVVYWARVSAHANGDVGLAAYVHLLKYCDYCFTCPLLTLDLMWSLNLPYKFTYSIWVGICIFSGIGSTKFQPPAKYMWFAFGMVIMFIVFWHIYSVVIIRLNQIFCGSTKKSANTLQIACAVYFSIWWGFPVLWFLLEFGVIGHPVTLCMHTVLDVSAKSFYGFMLLSFQLQAEREEWIFLPLQPKIAWNENASETESQADVELGYNSEYGFTGG